MIGQVSSGSLNSGFVVWNKILVLLTGLYVFLSEQYAGIIVGLIIGMIVGRFIDTRAKRKRGSTSEIKSNYSTN